jgi:hypothetical protein
MGILFNDINPGGNNMAEQTGIGKTDAVRRAMAKLGVNAGRAELHKFIKEELRVEMTPTEVSRIRGKLSRRAKKATNKPSPAAPPVPKPAATPAVSVAQAVTPAKGKEKSGISLQDIATAKDLLTRSSAGDLKQLLDLLVG